MNYLKFLILLPTLFVFTACGQGALDVKKLSDEVTSSNKTLEKLAEDVQIQSEDLDILIAEVENDPTIKKIEDYAQPSLIDLGKIKDLIKNGLKPILGNIGDFRSKIEDLKKRIEDQIAILDPNLPNQLDLISKLENLLDRMEQIEDRINSIIDKLKDKLLNLDTIFDRLLDKLDGSKFWHLPARMIVEEIRDKIQDKIDDLLGII